MKQKIYTIGLFTSILIFAGAILKVNHWPAAGIFLSIGVLMLVSIFLPIALINHYKSEESKKNLSLYIITWLTCFVVFLSMLFKLQYWPLANILLIIALPFPYVVFLPVFITVTSRDKNFNINTTVFVLLLLALNTVFSGLLALNVTKERIGDSFNLSKNYNKMELVLNQVTAKSSSVNQKIDELIKIVENYQEAILKQENISKEQWINTPFLLKKPDAKGLAMMAILTSSSPDDGTQLTNGLKSLINEMSNTPGYESIAKNASTIFDFVIPEGGEKDWAARMFNDNFLAWSMIYLDGLKTNLLLIRGFTPINT